MQEIVFARIDDRLIHGQIIMTWLQVVGADYILLVDEEIRNDEFLKRAIWATLPKGVHCEIRSVDECVQFLQQDHSKKVMLLAKSPYVFFELINKGVILDRINLGGLSAKKGRTRLAKNIFADEEERAELRRIRQAGTEIFIQPTPRDRPFSLDQVLP